MVKGRRFCYAGGMRRGVLAALLLATAGSAQADMAGPKGRIIDCYCTDSTGGRVELGETICLVVGGRAFLARCEMSLNVPMWRETGEGCLHSLRDRIEALQPTIQPGGVYPKI